MLRLTGLVVNSSETGCQQTMKHLHVVLSGDEGPWITEFIDVGRDALLAFLDSVLVKSCHDVPLRDGSGPSSDGLSCGPSYRVDIGFLFMAYLLKKPWPRCIGPGRTWLPGTIRRR